MAFETQIGRNDCQCMYYLHNLCVQANLSEPEIEELIDDFDVYEFQPDLVSARRTRQQIIIFFF